MLTIQNIDKLMHWSIRYDNDDVWKIHAITTLPDRYKIYLCVNNSIQSNCIDLSRIDDFTGNFSLDYGVKGGVATVHTLSDMAKLLKVMAPMFFDSDVYAILDSNGKITSKVITGIAGWSTDLANSGWSTGNWSAPIVASSTQSISTAIGKFTWPTPIRLTRK